MGHDKDDLGAALARTSTQLGAVFSNNRDAVVAAMLDAKAKLEGMATGGDPVASMVASRALERRQEIIDLGGRLSGGAESLRKSYEDDNPYDRTAAVLDLLHGADTDKLVNAYGEAFITEAERRVQTIFSYNDVASLLMEPTQIAAYVFLFAQVDLANAYTELPTVFGAELHAVSDLAATMELSPPEPILETFASVFRVIARWVDEETNKMASITSERERLIVFDGQLTTLESYGYALEAAAAAASNSYKSLSKSFSHEISWFNEILGDEQQE